MEEQKRAVTGFQEVSDDVVEGIPKAEAPGV
jgi:hypothetical protein